LLALLLAVPALGVDVVGTSVRLAWSAASGPVVAYRVLVSRSGSAFVEERSVPATAVDLSGAIGETLLVRVAAYDGAGRIGPLSAVSDPIAFVAPPPTPSGSADLDGNGRSDALAMDRATGALSAVLLGTDGSRRWVAIGAPRDTAMRALGFADVDADGRADVFWRNPTTGANELWLLRGLVYSVLALPPTATRFRLAAFRDFSGDRAADLLWHDPATGESLLWLLGAGGYRSALAVERAPAGMRLAGVCDVNGDRSPDLVWQHTTTRALEAWLMQGATPRAVSSLGVAASSSSIVGVGDLDASGVEDLVWRRRTSRGVQIDVWFLRSGAAPQLGVAARISSGRLGGVVDLDSTGGDDLVIESSAGALSGLAVFPQRVSGSATRWQTRAIAIAPGPATSWQFLTLD
jgi:hypothetical protein